MLVYKLLCYQERMASVQEKKLKATTPLFSHTQIAVPITWQEFGSKTFPVKLDKLLFGFSGVKQKDLSLVRNEI